MRQVEETIQQQAASSSQSNASTSAGAYRTPSTVNMIKAGYGNTISAPPGCNEALIFDMTEGDEDLEDFALEGSDVLVIEAADEDLYNIPVFPMDATDGDGVWTVWNEDHETAASWEPEDQPMTVNMVKVAETTGVIVDSGADVSVAPLCYSTKGCQATGPKIMMQDAQGRHIYDKGARNLTLEVTADDGTLVILRERFNIANVSSVILSLGRLLRSGWSLASRDGNPLITRGAVSIPVRLRRNTLLIAAVVAAISLMDSGLLPPELESLCGIKDGTSSLQASRCSSATMFQSFRWRAPSGARMTGPGSRDLCERSQQVANLDPVTFGSRSSPLRPGNLKQ